MASGLKGMAREIRGDPRQRRNATRLAADFDAVGGALSLSDDGEIVLDINDNGGLEQSDGLAINLATTPGLQLASNELSVLLDPTEPGLQLTSGLKVLLAANGGLELSSGLKAKVDTPLNLGASGIGIDAATTSVAGVVEMADARADSTQNSVTLTSVTDPADAPADADALRDDLVANALAELQTRDGELETAIETLAGEFNDLLSKLRSAGTLDT